LAWIYRLAANQLGVHAFLPQLVNPILLVQPFCKNVTAAEAARHSGIPAFRHSGIPAFRLPGFPASRLPGFPAFQMIDDLAGGKGFETADRPAHIWRLRQVVQMVFQYQA
jgi:hypothetical protein